jgi:hypothetical protein
VSDTIWSAGRHLCAASSTDAFLEIEAAVQPSVGFTHLDSLVENLLVTILRADDEAITYSRVAEGATQSLIRGLGQAQQRTVQEAFSLAGLRSRGVWFLPDTLRIRPGVFRLPYLFEHYPRFATAISMDEHLDVPLN